MKRVSLISAGALLLFVGAVAPAYAQQDQHEQGSQAPKQEQQAKPEQQQQAKPQAQPQAQQQKPQPQAKPAKQEQQRQPKAQPEQAKSNSKQPQQQTQSVKQEPQQQAKSQQAQTKQNNQQKQQQAKNQQVSQPRQQSASSRAPQRTEEAQTRQRAEPALRLSATSSSRIPDARFQSNFGSSHEFRIGSPRMVGGYSRFQYGGYWFGFVQPWPASWYYTDNVYVTYIDGQYYLCNPYYPGVHIAISVVM
jgi:hypothetical protein